MNEILLIQLFVYVSCMSLEYYGHISLWDTSQVTNMSCLFRNKKKKNFNDDIGSCDTSKVTDMSYMFYNTKKFNQDIGSWDTSNINMKSMFDDI